MARPLKRGLDYFPFDIDFFEDEKIGAISGEFGIKGEIATIKLLCAVYRNGYFLQWNEMLKMKLLKNLPGVSAELIDQIVSRLVKWGFYDQSLFDSDKILTSVGIQTRYFEAIKRRKTNEEFPYLLVNVCNNGVNDNNNSISADSNTQSKVKESKEEKEINKEKVFLLNGEEKIISEHLASFFRGMLDDKYQIEQLCMNNRLKPDILTDYIKQFFVLRSNENNREIQTLNDAQTYFARWLTCELEKKKKNNDEQPKRQESRLHPALRG